MSRRKSLKDQLRERDIDMWFRANDVMSVIRHGLRSDVWASDLMRVHFEMVYHYAHTENDRIDWDIKNARRLKLTPNPVAARIIERSENTSADRAT